MTQDCEIVTGYDTELRIRQGQAMELTFEWDNNKALANLKKHAVSFEEASTVFGDTLSVTVLDPLHSHAEDRFVTIGMSSSGRLLVVVHSDRGDQIRIVSARPATTKERKDYED